MRRSKNTITLLIMFCLLLINTNHLFSQTPQEFKERRDTVLESMEPNSIMIIRANTAMNDLSRFRQDNNFFYLTGIKERGAALILRKNPEETSGRRYYRRRRNSDPVMLFVRPVNPRMADWDPGTMGIEGAKEKLGFENVRPADEFQEVFESILLDSPENVYIDHESSGGLRGPLTPDEFLFNSARERGVDFKTIRASSIINKMRTIKSEAEIELLRKAIYITAEAHNENMRSFKPGMYEYQAQSIIEHVYLINGSPRPGFTSIAGSGRNSCILHWDANTRQTEPGDIMVIDIGAEYGMYTADITRTIPVNGVFSDRQKEIYEIVLEANETAIKMIAPGVNINDIESKAREIITDGLIRIGLIENRNEVYRYYFHGLSHPIGLQVHDVGRSEILEPGMVITIEPGIYVREENTGIRIEDDVLVTENGYEVLSKNTPKSIREIEKMMKEKGMDYDRYLIKK